MARRVAATATGVAGWSQGLGQQRAQGWTRWPLRGAPCTREPQPASSGRFHGQKGSQTASPNLAPAWVRVGTIATQIRPIGTPLAPPRDSLER